MAIITTTELRSRLQSDPTSERNHVTINGFHRAGVLVPIVNDHSHPYLLLTKRTEDVETHKGQISFPGGMVDSTDEDIVKTALREAEEELGLPPAAVEFIGLLDDHPTPTRFVITPVVGMIESLPPLKPNPVEVAEVLLAPLDFFTDPTSARSELREFRGKQHEVWFYQFGEHLIWGATAMITRSLLRRLRLL